MAQKYARIIQHRFAEALHGALLDFYDEEQRHEQTCIKLGLRATKLVLSELREGVGGVYERVRGNRVPIRLHFTGISGLKGGEFFRSLTNLHPDDPARAINDMLSWRQPGRHDVFFLFFMQQADNLMFFANSVRYERLSLASVPFTLERDWCPPPPMPERLVPQPKRLHQRFGGDPVTFYLDSRPYHRRLFIGGTDIQPAERPQVDVVFNVGENPSKWVKDKQTHPQDRWDNKGEDSEGMSLGVIRAEANWVISYLKKNQRVLVHCAAGMNRSSTICCAVLILLEGLTAEQALERLRGHHPWARPDSGHWLKLRWLAETNAHSHEQ